MPERDPQDRQSKLGTEEVQMGLDGPSRRIIVQPQEQPTEQPAIEPAPAETPEREPEKVPA